MAKGGSGGGRSGGRRSGGGGTAGRRRGPGWRAGALLAVAALLGLTLLAPLLAGQASPTPSPALPASLAPSAASSSLASAGSSASASPSASPSATARPTTAPTPTPRPAATAAPPATGAVPDFRHVYLIVMENRTYGEIVGNSAAPYINSLIARYGLATDYDAVAHPSEPNYVALFSGSTQGVTTDGTYNLPGRNLADQLDAAGRSWRVFAQNVPLGCYPGYLSRGGEDGSGTYTRKHEPAISFTDISGSPARCANITDFSHFDPAASDFELIVPNLCNDMHDCSTATGDAFLKGFVPRITSSPAFAGSVLFITWDEGSGSAGGGGQVATIVVSPLVAAGAKSATPHTHYSLLRTIQDAWGLPCLAASCAANDLREFFAR